MGICYPVFQNYSSSILIPYPTLDIDFQVKKVLSLNKSQLQEIIVYENFKENEYILKQFQFTCSEFTKIYYYLHQQQQIELHPNIVRIKGVYQDSQQSHIYVFLFKYSMNLMALIKIIHKRYRRNSMKLMMELIEENSSEDERIQTERIINNSYKYIIQQILLGIQYLRKHSIVHLDIKPENILIDLKTCEIKICDFDLSIFNNKYETQNVIQGTYEYLTPEQIKLKYQQNSQQDIDQGVDCWQIGILIYELNHNQTPFYSQNKMDILKNIMKNKVNFNNDVSQQCKDLIQNLLQINPKDRIGYYTIDEILYHEYLQGQQLEESFKNLLQIFKLI